MEDVVYSSPVTYRVLYVEQGHHLFDSLQQLELTVPC